MLSMGMSVI